MIPRAGARYPEHRKMTVRSAEHPLQRKLLHASRDSGLAELPPRQKPNCIHSNASLEWPGGNCRRQRHCQVSTGHQTYVMACSANSAHLGKQLASRALNLSNTPLCITRWRVHLCARAKQLSDTWTRAASPVSRALYPLAASVRIEDADFHGLLNKGRRNFAAGTSKFSPVDSTSTSHVPARAPRRKSKTREPLNVGSSANSCTIMTEPAARTGFSPSPAPPGMTMRAREVLGS